MIAASEGPINGALGWLQPAHASRAGLLAHLRRAGISPEDAEDIVQEAFLRISALPSVDPSRVLALVWTIVRRVSIDHSRRRSHLSCILPRLIQAPSPAPDEVALDRLEAHQLLTHVRGCSALERAVLDLRMRGYGPRETANHLGITPKAAENAMTRLRNRLRTMSRAPRVPSSGRAPLETCEK